MSVDSMSLSSLLLSAQKSATGGVLHGRGLMSRCVFIGAGELRDGRAVKDALFFNERRLTLERQDTGKSLVERKTRDFFLHSFFVSNF